MPIPRKFLNSLKIGPRWVGTGGTSEVRSFSSEIGFSADMSLFAAACPAQSATGERPQGPRPLDTAKTRRFQTEHKWNLTGRPRGNLVDLRRKGRGGAIRMRFLGADPSWGSTSKLVHTADELLLCLRGVGQKEETGGRKENDRENPTCEPDATIKTLRRTRRFRVILNAQCATSPRRTPTPNRYSVVRILIPWRAPRLLGARFFLFPFFLVSTIWTSLRIIHAPLLDTVGCRYARCPLFQYRVWAERPITPSRKPALQTRLPRALPRRAPRFVDNGRREGGDHSRD